MKHVNKLKEKGIIKEINNRYEYIENHVFTSPSAAADVIYFGSTNGLKMWKNKDNKSLKELSES